jgi:hypothetical protein
MDLEFREGIACMDLGPVLFFFASSSGFFFGIPSPLSLHILLVSYDVLAPSAPFFERRPSLLHNLGTSRRGPSGGWTFGDFYSSNCKNIVAQLRPYYFMNCVYCEHVRITSFRLIIPQHLSLAN